MPHPNIYTEDRTQIMYLQSKYSTGHTLFKEDNTLSGRYLIINQSIVSSVCSDVMIIVKTLKSTAYLKTFIDSK